MVKAADEASQSAKHSAAETAAAAAATAPGSNGSNPSCIPLLTPIGQERFLQLNHFSYIGTSTHQHKGMQLVLRRIADGVLDAGVENEERQLLVNMYATSDPGLELSGMLNKGR
jgi:hypothetical protein